QGRKKTKTMDKMMEMQKVEEERKALEAKLDMAEEERNKARAELEKREKDLLKVQQEHHLLLDKLEERRRRAEKLRRELEEKEQERLDIVEKSTSLQEEAQGKTKELEKVWTMLKAAKSEVSITYKYHTVSDQQGGTMPGLSFNHQSSLASVFKTVPCVFQKSMEYTGNNIRKQTPAPDKKEKDV
uniref:Uncharacterized protein n=1 Tax=Gasterosteus aculeatus TaxID=69293 RepID=G3Q5Z3_GASAC